MDVTLQLESFKKLEEWSRSNPDQMPIRNYIEQQRRNRGKTARRRKHLLRETVEQSKEENE